MVSDFQEFLLKSIPIAEAMGIRVEHVSDERVTLSAPLSNNVNHKNTAFGGSLHSVATLACWSLLHLKLKQVCGENVPIVIASSEISYLKPVTEDFQSVCKVADAGAWERFISIFRKRGKSRLTLTAQILQGDQVCVEYSGVFVAIRKQS